MWEPMAEPLVAERRLEMEVKGMMREWDPL